VYVRVGRVLMIRLLSLSSQCPGAEKVSRAALQKQTRRSVLFKGANSSITQVANNSVAKTN
jgi:hypothetical protein